MGDCAGCRELVQRTYDLETAVAAMWTRLESLEAGRDGAW